jgi:AcrR family transcriptional regulator
MFPIGTVAVWQNCRAMRHEFGSDKGPGVRSHRVPGLLEPSVPLDIGAQAQRRRILNAMAASCGEKTFAKTTIADIVERAGTSRGTFYKHFNNKLECFIATVDSFVAELQTIAVDARRDAEPGPETIHRAAKSVLGRLAEEPDHARLLVIEAPIVEPAIVGRCRDLVLAGLQAQWPLGSGARSHGADAALAFGRAQVLIAEHVAGGQTEQLPQLLPEIVYIALLPFVGQEDALEHANNSQ